MQVPPFWGYRMQCYGGTDSPILSIKELQKLLELTSRNSLRPMYLIYNSRNYQSLLAISYNLFVLLHLQQQKLLELTSPAALMLFVILIYNSRNYQSLLAWGREYVYITDLQQQKLLELTSRGQHVRNLLNLQQQKLLELTSPILI